MHRFSSLMLVLVLGTSVTATMEYPVPIGLNTQGVHSWDRTMLFADRIKHAKLSTSNLDAKGWPKEDCNFEIYANIPNSAICGEHRISWEGQATVSGRGIVISDANYDPATDRGTATGTIACDNADPLSKGNVYLYFSNTSGGVRNVRCMMPGHDFTDTFNKATIANFETLSIPVIRFMDYLSTNHAAEHCPYPQTLSWAERRPADFSVQSTYYNGQSHSYTAASWEYIIELCNDYDIDPWINIPVPATDEYIRNLAQLFKDNLEPGRRVYTEYGNENWNFAGVFGYQADWVKAAAVAEVNQNPNSNLKMTSTGEERRPTGGFWYGYRYHARRSKEIGEIFVDVYGPGSRNTIVRPLLMFQRGFVYLHHLFNYITEEFGPLKEYFYAAGGATYFGFFPDGTDGIHSEDDLFTGWREGAAMMGAHVVPEGYDYTNNRPLWKRALDFTRSSALCNYHDIKSFAYEGSNGTDGPDDFYFSAHRSDRNIELLRYVIGSMWHGSGNDLWMWFTYSISGETQSTSFGGGNFGLVWYPQDTTHGKFRAIRELMSSPREPLTQGIVLPTTLNADTSVYIGDNLMQPDEARGVSMPRKASSVNDDIDYFLVNARVSGTYEIRYELASGIAGQGKVLLLMKAEQVGELIVPAGAIVSEPLSLELAEGMHTLKFVPKTGFDSVKGWNVKLTAISQSAVGGGSRLPSAYAQTPRISRSGSVVSVTLPKTDSFVAELFSLSGKKLLRTGTSDGVLHFDTAKLPTGSYLLKLRGAAGDALSHVIVP